MGRYITVNVDVDVELDDIDTDDLIEELQRRGVAAGHGPGTGDSIEALTKIWELRRTGRSFDSELDQYIYNLLGKVI